MRGFRGAFRMQLSESRHKPGDLQVLATVPLFTVIFLAIFQHAGRDDLAGYAILAPALIAVWGMALLVSGEIIDTDRHYGTLESIVAAPARFAIVVLGRITAVTVVSLLGLAESWFVARVVFGVTITIHHPGVFTAALAATAVAMAGTAVIMAATFVLTRTARTFQNSLSYPFYVLGGVLVPVALLPDWLQPVSRLVFLSWAADLLRDSLEREPITGAGWRLAVILGLGAAGYALGRLLLARMIRRVRLTGTIGLA